MQANSFIQNLKNLRETQSHVASRESLKADRFNIRSTGLRKIDEDSLKNFDSSPVEETDSMFPKIRLISRYISQDEFKSALPAHSEVLTITDLYKQVGPPEFKRPPDASPNFALISIVATRSTTRLSSNGNKYVTLTLSDLKYDISLALHGKAHEKFWKLRPGTLVALLNPDFYVQKFENSPRSLALSVSRENCILEIGQAKDLGQCEATTSSSKYSKRCKNWVDVRKSRVCEFHIEQKAVRTKRPEFNATAAKLWDPQASGKASWSNGGAARNQRMTVYQGGEVGWKRGLQVDNQANYGRSSGASSKLSFSGFIDAPVGRVFSSEGSVSRNRNNSKLYSESIEEKRKRDLSDKRKLERATEDAMLKAKLSSKVTSGAKVLPEASGRVSKNSLPKPKVKEKPVFVKSQLKKLGFHPLSLPAAAATVNSGTDNASTKQSTSHTFAESDSESDLEII